MKKLLVLVACLGTVATAFGQGQLNFNNYLPAITPPIDARVFDVDGATYVDGANGWMGQLYAGADEASLAPIGTAVAFSAGTRAGRINGGAVTTEVAGGTLLQVQLRAWNSNDGAGFDEAMGAGGATGMSNIIPVTVAVAPALPPDLAGLTGFTVAVIPEPSTLALGLLGAVALVARRRR
jgi:hypothetical protein